MTQNAIIVLVVQVHAKVVVELIEKLIYQNVHAKMDILMKEFQIVLNANNNVKLVRIHLKTAKNVKDKIEYCLIYLIVDVKVIIIIFLMYLIANYVHINARIAFNKQINVHLVI